MTEMMMLIGFCAGLSVLGNCRQQAPAKQELAKQEPAKNARKFAVGDCIAYNDQDTDPWLRGENDDPIWEEVLAVGHQSYKTRRKRPKYNVDANDHVRFWSESSYVRVPCQHKGRPR